MEIDEVDRSPRSGELAVEHGEQLELLLLFGIRARSVREESLHALRSPTAVEIVVDEALPRGERAGVAREHDEVARELQPVAFEFVENA